MHQPTSILILADESSNAVVGGLSVLERLARNCREAWGEAKLLILWREPNTRRRTRLPAGLSAIQLDQGAASPTPLFADGDLLLLRGTLVVGRGVLDGLPATDAAGSDGCVVWRWVLNPGTEQTGAVGLNLLFEKIGLGFLKNGWYTDPQIGIKAVVIAATWQMAGYTMALYLAGLRGIPDDLREAARVDGASEWQVFQHIVFPLLRPVTLSAVIILGHISLKIFDLTSSMTGSGPGFATDVPAFYLFDTVFRGNHFSRGAAIAIILLVMVSLLVIPYLIYSARTEVER